MLPRSVPPRIVSVLNYRNWHQGLRGHSGVFSAYAQCCKLQQHAIVCLHWLEASCALMVLASPCTCVCQSSVWVERWASACRVSPSRLASEAQPVPDSDEDRPNGAGPAGHASPPQEASSDSDSGEDEEHVEQVEPPPKRLQKRAQAHAQQEKSQAQLPSQAQPSQAANGTQRAHGKAPLLALRAHPKVSDSNHCTCSATVRRQS